MDGRREELILQRILEQYPEAAGGSGSVARGDASQNGQILATRVGLKVPGELSFEEWEKAGAKLARISDSSTWCLGDWLVYGQDKYSERYRQAIAEAGLDYQTLRNYAWIARRFEWSRRRSKLSFQHHAEVAALHETEQDLWLDRAVEGRWSRNELRRQLRQSRQVTSSLETAVTLPRLPVSSEQVDRWRAAAEMSSSDFDQWVIAVLDDAATQTLKNVAA